MMRKTVLPILLVAAIAFNATAQTDLSIAYDNYSPGQVFAEDEIAPAFTVTNNGPQALLAGDTLFVTAQINGLPFGLDLLGNYTGIELVNDLPVGGTFSFDPGVLSGSLTLMFFPGATTLDICMVVWGKGLASVDLAGGTFPMDTDGSNNTVCVTFDPAFVGAQPTDLSIAYDNYTPGQVFSEDEIAPAFTVTNNGPEALLAGDTLYVTAQINGLPFGLDLLGNYTGIELANDLPVGGTFSFDPGVLSGSQTLVFFPGATALDICMVVWGEGLASVDLVGGTFPMDIDGSNNTVCATFDPTATAITERGAAVMRLFPNPATEQVEFIFGENGAHDVMITDATGRSVLNERVNGTDRWRCDVRLLTAGSYFYSVRGTSGVAQGSFVKQ
jgi:hypothetical protein